RRRHSHPEPIVARQLDSFPGACPCPLSTMAVVALRRRTVETNLQGDALAPQRAQRFEPAPGKQHAVGEDRDRRRRSACGEDLANIGEHKWLTAGDKNLTQAELRSLDSDPSDPLDTKSAPRCFG